MANIKQIQDYNSFVEENQSAKIDTIELIKFLLRNIKYNIDGEIVERIHYFYNKRKIKLDQNSMIELEYRLEKFFYTEYNSDDSLSLLENSEINFKGILLEFSDVFHKLFKEKEVSFVSQLLKDIFFEVISNDSLYYINNNNSVFELQQTIDGDVWISKYSKEKIDGTEQFDLFFNKNKKEINHEPNGLLRIYQRPGSFFNCLLSYCYNKMSILPKEIKQLNDVEGNIPFAADSMNSSSSFSKALFISSLEKTDSDFYKLFSIALNLGSEVSGFVEFFDGGIRVIQENTKDNKKEVILEIEEDEIGPLLVGLMKTPGRSYVAMREVYDIFIEKWNEKNQKN